MSNFDLVIELLTIEKYSLIKKARNIDRFEAYEYPYFQEAQKRISDINTCILEIDEAISLLKNNNDNSALPTLNNLNNREIYNGSRK